MKVFVDASGEKITLDVHDHDSIFDLKEKVRQSKGISFADKALYFQDERLVECRGHGCLHLPPRGGVERLPPTPGTISINKQKTCKDICVKILGAEDIDFEKDVFKPDSIGRAIFLPEGASVSALVDEVSNETGM